MVDEICKKCTRLLQDCRHVHKLTKVVNGNKIIISCIGYVANDKS